MPVVNKHQSDNLGPLSQLTLLAWHTSRKYIPMKTNVAVIIFKFFISFFCRSCLVVISMALSLNVKFMHGEMGVFYQEPRIQFYNVDYADLTHVKGVFETILVFWLNGNNTLKVSLWSAAIYVELANLQLNKSVIGVGAREIPLPSECVCGRPQNVFSVNSPSTPFHMIIPFDRRRIYLPTYCVRLLVRSWRDRHGSLNPYNININRPDRYSSGFGKYTDFRVFSLPFPLSLHYFFWGFAWETNADSYLSLWSVRFG